MDHTKRQFMPDWFGPATLIGGIATGVTLVFGWFNGLTRAEFGGFATVVASGVFLIGKVLHSMTQSANEDRRAELQRSRFYDSRALVEQDRQDKEDLRAVLLPFAIAGSVLMLTGMALIFMDIIAIYSEP
jgi:hypothetical protein